MYTICQMRRRSSKQMNFNKTSKKIILFILCTKRCRLRVNFDRCIFAAEIFIYAQWHNNRQGHHRPKAKCS